jgi:hypothetical protein
MGTAKPANDGSSRAKQDKIHHSGKPFMTASVNSRKNWFMSKTPKNRAKPAPKIGANCRSI